MKIRCSFSHFTCAILICKSSAIARYQAFTPNLPDATCLMADLFSGSLPRKGSSPPSPVLLLPPILNKEQNHENSLSHSIHFFG